MSADLLLLIGRGMLAACVAIMVILAVRGPLRRRFGAQVAYGFWLIVPAAVLASYLPARVITLEQHTPVAALGDGAANAEAAHTVFNEASLGASFDWAGLALAIWLLGAAISMLALWVSHQRFVAGLQLEREGQIFRAHGRAAGPALVGVFRPRVVVPADFERHYDETERMLVLAHERAHFTAGDAQINALAVIVQCINWFNPLFYIARCALRVDQELACDERVMGRYSGARRVYAEAMLKSHLGGPAMALGCAWPATGARPLKERIAHLSRPPTSLSARLGGVAFCASAIVAMGFGAWLAQPVRFAYAHAAPASSPAAETLGRQPVEEVARGETMRVQDIVEAGADVNAVTETLGRQLVEDIARGETVRAQNLIETGADVSVFVDGDGTPLIMAVRSHDHAMAARLIAAGADVNQTAPGEGNALIVAAREGQTGMMALLIEAGANVNGVVPGDETPLINAAGRGELDATRFLIANGADVNLAVDAQTERGLERRSPISVARRRGHDDIVRLLRANGASG
jgi:beta-lactamase regulating signal transducer with metallopeptidase domain